MTNQRPSKTHHAGARDSSHDMKMRNFFRECRKMFDSLGNFEVANFCEVIEEEYNAGRQLPSNLRDIERLFGI